MYIRQAASNCLLTLKLPLLIFLHECACILNVTSSSAHYNSTKYLKKMNFCIAYWGCASRLMVIITVELVSQIQVLSMSDVFTLPQYL